MRGESPARILHPLSVHHRRALLPGRDPETSRPQRSRSQLVVRFSVDLGWPFGRELTRDGLAAVWGRDRTGDQKPNHGARQMYDETDDSGRHRDTSTKIAAAVGVTRCPSTAASTSTPPPPTGASQIGTPH